jgi:hypothetical protein
MYRNPYPRFSEPQSQRQIRRHRFDTGMTSFSPVWVAETRTTFTSTSPAAFPDAMTSDSLIAVTPFGRMTQIAPFGTREPFSV